MKFEEFDFMPKLYSIVDSEDKVEEDPDIEYINCEEEVEVDSYFGDYGYEEDDGVEYYNMEEEDEVVSDLGEGYVPLYSDCEVEVIQNPIDTNYQLDDYEIDIVDGEVYYDDAVEEMKGFCDETESIDIDVDQVESVIKVQPVKSVEEEYGMEDVDPVDDKISKKLAKEHLDRVETNEYLLSADIVEAGKEETSWVDGDDMFGNDADVIIAEDPNQEIEEEYYVDGSYEEWVKENVNDAM